LKSNDNDGSPKNIDDGDDCRASRDIDDPRITAASTGYCDRHAAFFNSDVGIAIVEPQCGRGGAVLNRPR
jgi:hypothetical protein